MLTFASCSAIVSPDTGDLNAAPSPCGPVNCYVTCPCIEGGMGRQRCTAAEQFDDCVCGPAAMGVGFRVCSSETDSASSQVNVPAPAGSGG